MKAIAFKHLFTLAIAGALVAGAVPSFGQEAYHSAHWRDRGDEFREISRDLLTAERTLRTCLPIYDSRRAMAIDMNHLATLELRLAANGDHMTTFEARRNWRDSLDGVRRRYERRERSYSQAEIDQSNGAMREALSLERSARNALNAMRRDEHGHIGYAIAALDKAIDEMNGSFDGYRRRSRY